MPKFKIGKKARMLVPMTVKSIDRANYTLTMVASTQDVDRHGDTVVQSGWDLTQFEQNPVILNSHRYNDCTDVIANAVSSRIVGKGAKSRLEQEWKFAVDENPKAKIIFELYAGGFLHASSVGFIPKKFKQNKDGTTDYYVIEEQELLEVSAVSVPANARALAKSKGIDVDELPDEPEEAEQTDDEPDDEPAEPEETPVEAPAEPPAPPAVPPAAEETPSTKELYLSAVRRLSERERETVGRVADLLKGMVEKAESDSQRRKRVNQAVREMLKIK
jgi:HK97 family phage prohead protease